MKLLSQLPFPPICLCGSEKCSIARSRNKTVQTKILHDISMLWFSVNIVSIGEKDIIYWEVSKYDFVKFLLEKQLLKAISFLNSSYSSLFPFILSWSEVKSLSRVRIFSTPWTIAYQAPPSMRFSRQEYWSGLPFPSPGDLSDPGIEPGCPALQADTLTSEPPGKPIYIILDHHNSKYILMVANTQNLSGFRDRD